MLLEHARKPLSEITLEDLQAWSDSMAKASSASRRRRLNAARSLFRYASQVGLIPADPSRGLRLPKAESITAPARVLTEQDVLRMIGAETEPRRRALLRLLYVTALRASEAAQLRWQHMTPRKGGGGEARILGKGSKARIVEITPALWRELAELTPQPRPDSPVIPGRDGLPIDRNLAWSVVKRAAARIGVPEASTHWLRHSHATHALDRGALIHNVRDQLGHASLATTSTYVHAKPGVGSARYLPEPG